MFEKLIERVMCNKLKLFSRKNNILYKYQFGFRENHSTAHALIDLTDCTAQIRQSMSLVSILTQRNLSIVCNIHIIVC